MSFSGSVKEELIRQEPKKRHCRTAELAAVIRLAGEADGAGDGIQIRAESAAAAKRYYTLLKNTFGGDFGVEIRDAGGGKKSRQYRIRIGGEKKAEISAAVCLADDERLRREVLGRTCCRRAFIRGAFLAAGTVNNPGKSYHFEIACREREQAEGLCSLIGGFGISAKLVSRKNRFGVYIKDGNGIADVLNVMEAYRSAAEFENVRIVKGIRNSANRQYNCDAANISKTVRASARQMEEIRLIEETAGLGSLPPSLRETAEARLEHPDASLEELGQYLSPPVGKSGMNHRMRKLEKTAEEIRERGAAAGSRSLEEAENSVEKKESGGTE